MVSLARLWRTGEWAGEEKFSSGESMPYHRKSTLSQTCTITNRHPAATDVNVTLPPYSVWIEVTENTLGKRIAAVSALCPRQQHLQIPTEEPEGAIIAINQTEWAAAAAARTKKQLLRAHTHTHKQLLQDKKTWHQLPGRQHSWEVFTNQTLPAAPQGLCSYCSFKCFQMLYFHQCWNVPHLKKP